MFREHRIRVNGVELNCAEGPRSGPPLVLLHGDSSGTPGDYSIRSFTDDIVAFLDRVVPEPVALFGHSLGAEVAVWTAARRPDRVRAVIVEDGPFTGMGAIPLIARQREQLDFQRRYAGSQMAPSELALLMPDLPFEPDEHGRPILARDVLGCPHPEYLEWAEMIRTLDPSFLDALSDYERFSAGYGLHLLSDITCPVLILRAGDEGALPIEEAQAALDVMPDARLVTLEGVGHGMHVEAPDMVLDAALPFLEEAA